MQFHLPCLTYYREIIVKSEPWSKYFSEVQSLACSILQYAEYLDSQVKKVKVNHTLSIPVRDINTLFQQDLYFLNFCS